MSFSLDRCKYDFASDNINIIVLVYDQSGSMSYDEAAIVRANRAFLSDFLKFEEKGSIAISKVLFDESYDMTPFLNVKDFSTYYSAGGGTKLYYTIAEVAKNVIAYYEEITKRLNVRARITFLVFSDGCDSYRYSSEISAAKDAVKQLNSLDATTVFVAFRDAIKNEDGAKLGFTCTRDITNVSELISCLGNELSKSCKEQSKSAHSLKSSFFSVGAKNAEEDSVNEPAFDDDDFFNV